MKRNPAEDHVRRRLAPGVLSLEGFLGTDARNIADIVAADIAELEAAGVAAADLADLFDELHAAADEALENPRQLFDGRVTVRVTEVMGRLPCPFGCGHLAHKGVVEVRTDGKTLLLTPLHSHLIREHGFFQGRGAPYRIEPRVAAALYRLCRGTSPD